MLILRIIVCKNGATDIAIFIALDFFGALSAHLAPKGAHTAQTSAFALVVQKLFHKFLATFATKSQTRVYEPKVQPHAAGAGHKTEGWF